MSGTVILGGKRLPLLAHVADVGQALGLKSRSTAYRLSRDWPRTGQYIIVPALLEQLGLAVHYVDETSARPVERHAGPCEGCPGVSCATCPDRPRVSPGEPHTAPRGAARHE